MLLTTFAGQQHRMSLDDFDAVRAAVRNRRGPIAIVPMRSAVPASVVYSHGGYGCPDEEFRSWAEVADVIHYAIEDAVADYEDRARVRDFSIGIHTAVAGQRARLLTWGVLNNFFAVVRRPRRRW